VTTDSAIPAFPPIPANVSATRPDFPIAWDDPADAELTWEWDDMHTAACLQPLSWDYGQALALGFGYHYERHDQPISMRALVFNGYLYFCYQVHGPDDQREALWQSYLQKKRELTPASAAYWRRAVPELKAIYDWIRNLPVEQLEGEDLANEWERVWAGIERCWGIHFEAIMGPYQVLDDLADLYESVVAGAPPGEALRLTQGSIDELADVDVQLGRLTDHARALPEVANAVAADPRPTLADLERLAGGGPFVAEVRAFLDRHGHLGSAFEDLGHPCWEESPGMILGEIAKRLAHPTEPALERAARLAREADELADAFRARVADDPTKLAEFERLLALAREIGPITELHNYWIDRMALARLRSFAMRVGERLVGSGVMDRADDILYLRRAEVRELLRASRDCRELIAGRQADHRHYSAIRPPLQVGKPKAPEDGGRFSGARFESTDDAVLRGTGASAGVVRGPARVVLGPQDFDSVQPGDIVIAPSSNPSWVPIFVIAAGLVTNTGGVLSHAAVVAREFGQPAVVGTGDATIRIRDGQTVELDGTTGVVRLS
jgi:pyruvate,water dikinase